MAKCFVVILTILVCLAWSMEENITKISSPVNTAGDERIVNGKQIDWKELQHTPVVMSPNLFKIDTDFENEDESELKSYTEGWKKEAVAREEKEINHKFLFNWAIGQNRESMNKIARFYDAVKAVKKELKKKSPLAVKPTVVPTTKPTTANAQNSIATN